MYYTKCINPRWGIKKDNPMLFDRKVIDTHVHIHKATDEKTLEMLEEWIRTNFSV